MEEKNKAIFAVGNQSVKLPMPIYIRESASIVGEKEGKGPLGSLFDMVGDDELFGCASWEEAESTLQKEAVTLALGKSRVNKNDVRYLFAGDLLGQTIATSFGLREFEIPLFGLYGACSTCGETISLASMVLGGGFAQNVMCVTSSHFASAEKEFRFPMEYGGQRPPCATRTVTGSGAFLLSTEKGQQPKALITGVTTGKIVDLGVKDSFNMGCSMAPAAADVIAANLRDFQRQPSDYDRIITGDLGEVGQQALFELMRQRGFDITSNHMDCGMEIFARDQKGTLSGGSGCGCAATVLSAFVLKKLQEKVWKRVLFIPTGALLNKTSFNEGQTVPGIAHGVVLESC
ncbi:MAG: stage V sporulation protein AD [Lachnospiraceae bacterium]|nr:stage V sporulation protein AD [Lachnospiraceae bacterium]